MPKHPILKCGLFVFYLLFLLLISEFILKTFFPIDFPVIDTTTMPFIYQISDNPKMGYALRPGMGDMNSAGFRDFEYPKNKNPDVARIAVIGDSIAFGIGASQRETAYAKRLEMLLNKESKKRFEVLNFGVPGYGTVQIFERFKDKVMGYEPDIVIYGYWFNDFQRYGGDRRERFLVDISRDSLRAKIWEFYSSSISKHALFKKMATRILESQLFQRSCLLSYRLRKHFSAQDHTDRFFSNKASDDAGTPKYWYGVFSECVKKCDRGNNMRFLDKELNEQDFYEYWNAFHGLADDCKKHAVRLILLLTPVLSDFSDYQYLPLHEFMHKLAESMGIEVLDTLGPFSRENYKELRMKNRDLCHFNDRGHFIVAKTIAEYLDRNPGTTL
jgi:lysophospholipase L1-like esterase